METTISHNTPATDRFSWKRVAMVGRYYYPTLRLQIILYPLISLAVGIATYSTKLWHYSALIEAFYGILSVALSFTYYWAPTVFSRSNGRAIEVMLPARSSEKSTFIVLYTIVGISALVYLPQFLCYIAFTLISGDSSILSAYDMLHLTTGERIAAGLFSALQSLAPICTCLLAVFAYKKSRVAMGILWSIVSLIGLALVAMIYTIIYIASNGVERFSNIALGGSDAVEQLMHIVSPIAYVCGAFSLIYVLAIIWFTVRTIHKTQI